MKIHPRIWWNCAFVSFLWTQRPWEHPLSNGIVLIVWICYQSLTILVSQHQSSSHSEGRRSTQRVWAQFFVGCPWESLRGCSVWCKTVHNGSEWRLLGILYSECDNPGHDLYREDGEDTLIHPTFIYFVQAQVWSVDFQMDLPKNSFTFTVSNFKKPMCIVGLGGQRLNDPKIFPEIWVQQNGWICRTPRLKDGHLMNTCVVNLVIL